MDLTVDVGENPPPAVDEPPGGLGVVGPLSPPQTDHSLPPHLGAPLAAATVDQDQREQEEPFHDVFSVSHFPQ